jgi:hypothetical protein
VAGGEIFVVCREDDRIRVYPATASGDVPPVRVLSTSPAPVSDRLGAISVVGNELYVLARDTDVFDPLNPIAINSYLVYDASADGAVDPIRHVTNLSSIASGGIGNQAAIYAW